ncbi:MAG: hypothetical protein KC910_34185 [Candidatus Eremiobacteraeota bacterium]|nr:hypothetical protein [Candidatus Eremiobacteraeota bacterium]
MKLEDFRPGIRSLEISKNPFGPVVAAHLHVRSGGPGSPRRQRVKQRLVRQLHESGFSSDDIRQLYRLIDWFLQLDRVQEEVFWLELRRYERKHEMPYITSVERIGHKKGLEQGLKRGLEQGLEEGLQKGRAEGQMEGHARGVRDSIRTVLTARFGDGCLERLGDLEDVSDPSQLSALTLASATVPSFEDFLTILSA